MVKSWRVIKWTDMRFFPNMRKVSSVRTACIIRYDERNVPQEINEKLADINQEYALVLEINRDDKGACAAYEKLKQDTGMEHHFLGEKEQEACIMAYFIPDEQSLALITGNDLCHTNILVNDLLQTASKWAPGKRSL